MLRNWILPFLLVVSGAPLHAEPIALAGPLDEQLGVALALGEQCQSMRPFEFAFLHREWRKAFAGSEANRKLQSDAAAANKGPLGFTEAAKVTWEAERAIEAGYRAKAVQIGCADGTNYVNRGLVEAYKAAGTQVLLALNLRGQAQVAPFMTPLSDEDRAVAQMFGQAAAEKFGAEMPQFEQLLGQLGQVHMQSYANLDPAVAGAYLEGDQGAALDLIYLDGVLGARQYAGTGRILDDGKGFGAAGSRWAQEGSAYSYSVFAGPKTVVLEPGTRSSDRVRGKMVLARRNDGVVVIGMYGQAFENYQGSPNGGADNGTLPPIKGEPLQFCPFSRCLMFQAADIAKLPTTAGEDGGEVWFFAGNSESLARNKLGSDGIKLKGAELTALLASAAEE
jgi:hypothetical protein